MAILGYLTLPLRSNSLEWGTSQMSSKLECYWREKREIYQRVKAVLTGGVPNIRYHTCDWKKSALEVGRPFCRNRGIELNTFKFKGHYFLIYY